MLQIGYTLVLQQKRSYVFSLENNGINHFELLKNGKKYESRI